jgi:hypothetical protein
MLPNIKEDDDNSNDVDKVDKELLIALFVPPHPEKQATDNINVAVKLPASGPV